ncbi:hypothetical protein LTR85_009739 [Meristemomyces frigidus]|nr:hypothetical protein LTR85_009739 [Meristemomyces frigidus]
MLRLSEKERDEAAEAWNRTPSQAAAHRRRTKAAQLAELSAQGPAKVSAKADTYGYVATKKPVQASPDVSRTKSDDMLADNMMVYNGFDCVIEEEMRWLCERLEEDWRVGPEVLLGAWSSFSAVKTMPQASLPPAGPRAERLAAEASFPRVGNAMWEGREIPSMRQMERPAFGSDLGAAFWADAKCRLWSSPYQRQLSPWGKLLEGHIVFAELRKAQETDPKANKRSVLSDLEDQKRHWAKNTGLQYVGFGHDRLYSRD